jgi:hypothetical protein
MAIEDFVAILLQWLPYTARRAIKVPVKEDDTHPSLSPLLQHPGLAELASNPNVKPVLGAARMLSKDSNLPDDHMVRHLCCLYSRSQDEMMFFILCGLRPFNEHSLVNSVRSMDQFFINPCLSGRYTTK